MSKVTTNPNTHKNRSFLDRLFCCLSAHSDGPESNQTPLTSLNRYSLQQQNPRTSALPQEKQQRPTPRPPSTPLITGTQGEGDSRLFDGRWSPSNTSNVYGKKQIASLSLTALRNEPSRKSLRDSANEKGREGEISENQVITSASNGSDSPSLHPIPPVPKTDETSSWLLEPIDKSLQGRKCLVLDLDETLVHSSFKYIHQADFVIPVEIESQYYNVYVIKRPGVDEFMKRVGELYELVVFTASVSKYGDPLLDQLDINRVIHHRLFRESCYNYNGNYIKNLAQLGRPLEDTIIIDNSPGSYILHPQHAVPISSWFSDIHDNELLDMIPFLEDLAKKDVKDVSLVLDMNI